MAEYRERMVVNGMVQGVGFRYFTCRLAQEYPVTGYVRNLRNGDVEIVAEGTKDAVKSFLFRVGRGPGYAHIISIKSFVEEPQGNFKVFGLRY
jgi:acylphosphatase